MISAAELKNIDNIKKDGLEALSERLGPVGMVQFIRLLDSGNGDFTQERREILDDVRKEEILDFLKS